jgi:hypothetical protein
MISLDETLQIHEILIGKFGGLSGIRDLGILESAINRPYQTLIKRNYIRTLWTKRPQFLKA